MSDVVLVTAALPYANGSIHLGHLVEYIMTDIYVRALRMTGKEAIFICADDTHGTPIELNARKAGVAPEEFVARFAKEHLEDFTAFGIAFDSFHSTNSEENRRWVHEIFDALKAKNLIEKRPLEQFYDEQAQQFLPDRFVKGTCPFCGTSEQFGDVCEACGKTYDPSDLKEPYSVLTNTKPVRRTSEHLFVNLQTLEHELRAWFEEEGHLQPAIRNFVRGWLEAGLKDWCISRDTPYFGFPIPGEPGKYFYVWVDAPIGYISSTEAWAKSRGTPHRLTELWREGKMKLVHVIGKDIVYFHTLFWPALLASANLKKPDYVHVHGFLTVEGKKMSKTRGTFVQARTYLEHLDPLYLRWFYASRLGSSADDIDLSAEEFANIVNAELVNNVANLVSRGAKFLANKIDGKYASDFADLRSYQAEIQRMVEEAIICYEKFDQAGAMSLATKIATRGNRIFQENEPWKLVKKDPEAARKIVTLCLNLARAAVVLVAPAAPDFAQRAYKMLGLQGGPQRFAEAVAFDLLDTKVGDGDILAQRISKEHLERIFEASKPVNPEAKSTTAVSAPAPIIEPIEDEITIDTFSQIDLRVGLVVDAQSIPEAKKLLKLSIDLGEGRLRTIFAGLAQIYNPDELTGKKVVVVANLKPRKMRFGVSEGMVLAAGKQASIIDPGAETEIGSRIS
ncbi:MAG: methionine--tRNA ligase [Myxococcales bacterium]|nr:methionine--tRNA ligase [Myxococcales bacterium]